MDVVDAVVVDPDVGDEALKKQVRDRLEGLEVVPARVVHDLDDRAPSVEAEHDLLEVGAQQALGEIGDHRTVDREDRVECWKLLEQAPPFVDPAQAFHEQTLGRLFDHRVAVDGLELDREGALRHTEQPVHGLLGLESAHAGVDDRSIAKPDGGIAEIGLELNGATLARNLDGLKQVDDRHVGELARELGPRRVLALELLSLLALHEHAQASRHLFDVDGFDEVVLDAEFQAADLVLDGLGRGQEYEGDPCPVGVVLDLGAKLEAVATGQARIRDDQIGFAVFENEQRLIDVFGGRDGEARLAQADLEHAATSSVAVDEE